MDPVKIYNNLHYISEGAAMNITMVLFGVRPAFYYDYQELNALKMKKLLKYLDTFDERGIKYKFGNKKYIDKNKVIDEGPLIYNIHKLNKKTIHKIENQDIEELENDIYFQSLLGIGNVNDVLITYRYTSYGPVNNGLVKFQEYLLYGFYCKNKINFKKLYDRKEELETFVKKINSRNTISLCIS